MMMVTETESNGQKSTHRGHDHHDCDDHLQGSEEKARRHPRWTREETLSLIQAKEITESTPHKGRKISSSSCAQTGSENSEPKWVMISAQCRDKGMNRGPAQCRKRWSNLIGDYKKVKLWEDGLSDNASHESFWAMRNDMRKGKKLPVSFDREVFRVLEAQEVGPADLALSPVPLRAVSAEGVEKEEDDMEVEQVEDESEPETEVVEVEDSLVSEDRGEGKEEEVLGRKLEEEKIVTDSPVKELCSPEPISEQHPQAFRNQKTYTTQATGASRESWPGISYWDSQVRGKKRRISTDRNHENDVAAHIMRVFETNSKILHDQLDAHTKNCQLDREHRKENNDALVAALYKLTEAVVKIAEKLNT